MMGYKGTNICSQSLPRLSERDNSKIFPLRSEREDTVVKRLDSNHTPVGHRRIQQAEPKSLHGPASMASVTNSFAASPDINAASLQSLGVSEPETNFSLQHTMDKALVELKSAVASDSALNSAQPPLLQAARAQHSIGGTTPKSNQQQHVGGGDEDRVKHSHPRFRLSKFGSPPPPPMPDLAAKSPGMPPGFEGMTQGGIAEKRGSSPLSPGIDLSEALDDLHSHIHRRLSVSRNLESSFRQVPVLKGEVAATCSERVGAFKDRKEEGIRGMGSASSPPLPSTSPQEGSASRQRQLDFLLLEAETYLHIAQQNRDVNEERLVQASIDKIKREMRADKEGDEHLRAVVRERLCGDSERAAAARDAVAAGAGEGARKGQGQGQGQVEVWRQSDQEASGGQLALSPATSSAPKGLDSQPRLDPDTPKCLGSGSAPMIEPKRGKPGNKMPGPRTQPGAPPVMRAAAPHQPQDLVEDVATRPQGNVLGAKGVGEVGDERSVSALASRTTTPQKPVLGARKRSPWKSPLTHVADQLLLNASPAKSTPQPPKHDAGAFKPQAGERSQGGRVASLGSEREVPSSLSASRTTTPQKPVLSARKRSPWRSPLTYVADKLLLDASPGREFAEVKQRVSTRQAKKATGDRDSGRLGMPSSDSPSIIAQGPRAVQGWEEARGESPRTAEKKQGPKKRRSGIMAAFAAAICRGSDKWSANKASGDSAAEAADARSSEKAVLENSARKESRRYSGRLKEEARQETLNEPSPIRRDWEGDAFERSGALSVGRPIARDEDRERYRDPRLLEIEREREERERMSLRERKVEQGQGRRDRGELATPAAVSKAGEVQEGAETIFPMSTPSLGQRLTALKMQDPAAEPVTPLPNGRSVPSVDTPDMSKSRARKAVASVSIEEEEPSVPTPSSVPTPDFEDSEVEDASGDDEDSFQGLQQAARAIASEAAKETPKKNPVTSFSRRKGPEERAREAAETATSAAAAAEAKQAQQARTSAVAAAAAFQARAVAAASADWQQSSQQATNGAVEASAAAAGVVSSLRQAPVHPVTPNIEKPTKAFSRKIRKGGDSHSGQHVVVGRALLREHSPGGGKEGKNVGRRDSREGISSTDATGSPFPPNFLLDVRRQWLMEQRKLMQKEEPLVPCRTDTETETVPKQDAELRKKQQALADAMAALNAYKRLQQVETHRQDPKTSIDAHSGSNNVASGQSDRHISKEREKETERLKSEIERNAREGGRAKDLVTESSPRSPPFDEKTPERMTEANAMMSYYNWVDERVNSAANSSSKSRRIPPTNSLQSSEHNIAAGRDQRKVAEDAKTSHSRSLSPPEVLRKAIGSSLKGLKKMGRNLVRNLTGETISPPIPVLANASGTVFESGASRVSTASTSANASRVATSASARNSSPASPFLLSNCTTPQPTRRRLFACSQCDRQVASNIQDLQACSGQYAFQSCCQCAAAMGWASFSKSACRQCRLRSGVSTPHHDKGSELGTLTKFLVQAHSATPGAAEHQRMMDKIY